MFLKIRDGAIGMFSKMCRGDIVKFEIDNGDKLNLIKVFSNKVNLRCGYFRISINPRAIDGVINDNLVGKMFCVKCGGPCKNNNSHKYKEGIRIKYIRDPEYNVSRIIHNAYGGI